MVKKQVLYLAYTAEGYKLSQLKEAGVNGVMVAVEGLSSRRRAQLGRLGLEVGVAVGAVPRGKICPASSQVREHLKRQLVLALKYKPDIIWLDHLRFGGRWESAGPSYAARKRMVGIHKDCLYCKGKERSAVLIDLVLFVREFIGGDIQLGYYAVPFRHDEHRRWYRLLGQDHLKLSGVFDFVSPMLYHRMLGKQFSYIGDYVKYLDGLGVEAEILPIIQVKDMPDDLADKLSISEIEKAVGQALTAPSVGVALFCWDHVIEKGKDEGVTRILQRMRELNQK